LVQSQQIFPFHELVFQLLIFEQTMMLIRFYFYFSCFFFDIQKDVFVFFPFSGRDVGVSVCLEVDPFLGVSHFVVFVVPFHACVFYCVVEGGLHHCFVVVAELP
jgi:hypothetical protein